LCAWASHTFCTEMNEICYPVRALWKVFAKYYMRFSKKILVAVQLLYKRVLAKNANASIQVSGGSRRGKK